MKNCQISKNKLSMISKSLFLIFVAVGAKKAKQEECKDSFLECYKYKSSCNIEKFQKMCPQTCQTCPEDLLSARGSGRFT